MEKCSSDRMISEYPFKYLMVSLILQNCLLRILAEDKLEAVVADFGLARVLKIDENNPTLKQESPRRMSLVSTSSLKSETYRIIVTYLHISLNSKDLKITKISLKDL